MQRLSKHRGAISIFLLLIFMVSYVFMGLLVDAGRYRLAQVYAEAALDNATTSVLSNYNRMVYELYGLFAVDTEAKSEEDLEKEINKLYHRYLDETMGIISVDPGIYATELNALFGTDEKVRSTAGLYDFAYDIECGTTITLADMENVESQIIEYMKFRAPVELVADMKGFLGKLHEILTMKNRVEEALKKSNITKEFETQQGDKKPLSEDANDLLRAIGEFKGKLFEFTLTPEKKMEDIEKKVEELRKEPPSMAHLGSAPKNLEDFYKRPKDEDYGKRDYEGGIDDVVNKARVEWDGEIVRAEEKFKEDVEKKEDILRGNTINLNGSYVADGAGTTTTNSFWLVDKEYYYNDNFDDYMKIYDDLYDVIRDSEEEKVIEFCNAYAGENGIKNTYEKQKNAADQKLQKVLQDTPQTLKKQVGVIETNAALLYAEAVRLQNEIDRVAGRYKEYIDRLEAAKNEEGYVENKDTVYGPDINLARSNAGTILKNKNYFMRCSIYLESLANGFECIDGKKLKLSDAFYQCSNGVYNSDLKGHFFYESTLSLLGKDADVIGKYRSGSRHTKILEDDEYYYEKYKYYQILNYPLHYYIKGYYVASPTKENFDIKYLTDITNYYEDRPVSPEVINYSSQGFREGHGLELMRGVLVTAQESISVLRSLAYSNYAGELKQDVELEQKQENTKKKADENVNSKDAEGSLKEPQTIEGKELDTSAIVNHPEYLKVTYQFVPTVEVQDCNVEYEINEKVNISTMTKILEAGATLIKGLGEMLENARDNLYVDAYVMSMFPNYKDNYKNADSSSKLGQERYQKYQASWAEVEYIITGAGAGTSKGKKETADWVFNEMKGVEGFGMASVRDMRIRLMGTRLLFNLLAMFTDPAKQSQASMLCCWAGPLAPVLSIVLMVAWAVAESVLDVMVLMGDAGALDVSGKGEVPLFKQGKDWFFSLEGAVTGLVELGVNALADDIVKAAEQVTSSMENKINGVIYDVYASAEENVDKVLEDARGKVKGVVEEWGDEICKNIDEFGADVEKDNRLGEFDRAAAAEAKNLAGTIKNNAEEWVDESFATAKKTADNALGSAKDQAVAAVSKLGKAVMDKTKKEVESTKKQATEFISEKISNVIPIGTVKDSGTSSVMMTYKDYLYFFLFTMNRELKIKRIMAVIQANIRVGEPDAEFYMHLSPVVVWADMEGTMKYMFLSEPIVPEGIKKKGRMRFKVISAQSY